MPPATAAPPRAEPSPPDSAVAPPRHLGFPQCRGPPLAGPLSEKPRQRSEAVPDSTEDDARTPGSAEFFLREPPESLDDNTPMAHATFTYEQQRQLNAQVYVYGDLRNEKPPAEHTMVHAFGEPAEGQKHVWQEVWRAAVDRGQRQKSIVSGYDTPPSSSLIGSCTSESKDTTVCKTVISEPHSSELHQNSLQHDAGEEASQVLDVGSFRGPPEKHTEGLKQQNGEEVVIISEPKQHAGGEETSQVPDVGSARDPPEKHTVLKQQNGEEAVIISEPKQHAGGEEATQVPDVGSARDPPEKHTVHKQQNGEEAVIISEPKQHAGVEEARQGVDVGSARSHPLGNITEHYCNLALDDKGSETRSLSKKKPDPCVKCGKEGQLLKCRTCSLAAHGSCFGSSVRFDDSGLFDCPVCFFKKADEAYEKAKIIRSEARKNLSAFFCWDQSVKQHNENQSVKQGYHQSEAANHSRKDGQPCHEKRNAASDACPEAVAAEKTTTFGPNPGDAKAHEVGNSSSSQEVPHSSHNRLSPIADRNIEADKENDLMNSPMTRSRRVRFYIKERVVSHCYGKASGCGDQFMHSPARKRYYAQPLDSSPGTPPARSPLGSTRRHGTSTARHKMTRWTRAEEVALREGVANYLAEHPNAATGNRNISWVRILEDGGDSFNPVRRSCHLMKKWGRMKQQGRAL